MERVGVSGAILDEGQARLKLHVSSSLSHLHAFCRSRDDLLPTVLTHRPCVDPENLAADHLAFYLHICLELQK